MVVAALAAPCALAATPADCVADVRVEDRGINRAPSLAVVLNCRANGAVRFVADSATVAHLSDARDGDAAAVTESAGSWTVTPQGGSATLRYSFDLGAYARDIDRVTAAVERGGAAMAILSTWLVEPRLPSGAVPVIDIRIATPPDIKAALALPRIEGGWRLQGATVRFAGYSVIGRFDRELMSLPGAANGTATLDVARLDGVLAVTRAELLDWIRKTAMAHVDYWQGFTTSRVLLAVVPTPGRPRVVFGRVVPGGGVSVMLQVGSRATLPDLWDDWILPHEFVHTGMPMITGRSSWVMEGAATYVEPIIRARAGFRREADVWREWIEQMPRGAGALQNGLSGGSPYWGGALFMLLTDIEIRRATAGAKGLEHCLRGALRAGGDMAPAERWPLATFAQRCDGALGTPVMAMMIERHLGRSVEVDLPALWRDLGVRLTSDGVVVDDSAPLAWIRKVLVMGRA